MKRLIVLAVIITATLINAQESKLKFNIGFTPYAFGLNDRSIRTPGIFDGLEYAFTPKLSAIINLDEMLILNTGSSKYVHSSLFGLGISSIIYNKGGENIDDGRSVELVGQVGDVALGDDDNGFYYLNIGVRIFEGKLPYVGTGIRYHIYYDNKKKNVIVWYLSFGYRFSY